MIKRSFFWIQTHKEAVYTKGKRINKTEKNVASFKNRVEKNIEIEHHDLPNYGESLELMEKAKLFSKQEDVIVLIDAPGTISESFLIPIFAMSDVIICPFTYQNLVLSSTSLFIRILQELKKEFKYMKAINIFVPNMVRKGVGTKDEWTEWEKTDKIFQEFGKISPRIYYKEELKRINTIFSTTKQREELKNCFAFLDRYIL